MNENLVRTGCSGSTAITEAATYTLGEKVRRNGQVSSAMGNFTDQFVVPDDKNAVLATIFISVV